MTLPRRYILKAGLALAAFGGVGIGASAKAAARRISVNESFVFAPWLAAVRAAAAKSGNAGDGAFLRALDQQPGALQGIGAEASADTLRLVALPAPGLEPFNPDEARALSVAANDRLARVVRASRGGVSGLATIAANDPSAASEAERAITRLGLAGLSLGANRGLRLDHPSLRPVFAFAADVGAPVYVPAAYAPITGAAPYRAMGSAGVITGAANDSAQHAFQLIFGGVLDRFPNLTVVLARLGEGTPYWYTQMQEAQAAMEAAGRSSLRRPIEDYFRRNILLTTADMTSAETLRFCGALLGAERVIDAQGGPGGRRANWRA